DAEPDRHGDAHRVPPRVQQPPQSTDDQPSDDQRDDEPDHVVKPPVGVVPAPPGTLPYPAGAVRTPMALRVARVSAHPALASVLVTLAQRQRVDVPEAEQHRP